MTDEIKSVDDVIVESMTDEELERLVWGYVSTKTRIRILKERERREEEK